MGFFEDIFGQKKGNEAVGLADLGAWLVKGQHAEAEEVLQRGRPILDSINDNVERLREDLKRLEQAPLNDVDPRYGKIVRTAKPAYVKAMLLTIDSLAYNGSTLEDMARYDKRLGEGLDMIGKVSFGDGKFLPYAFQSEMGRIQPDCRRLLALREELARILKPNNKVEQLRSIKTLLTEYDSLRERMSRLKADAASSENDVRLFERDLKESEASLATLRRGLDYGSIGRLGGRLKELQAEMRSIESLIHSALSPLKSSLRKYEKTVADSHLAKLVTALQDNPVETFLSVQDDEVEAALCGFAAACSAGSVSLKDAGKTAGKIGFAQAHLTKELRNRHHGLEAETDRLSRELELLPAAESEKRLLARIGGLERDREGSIQAASDLREKEKALDREAAKTLAELKIKLLDMGVDLA